MGLSKLREIGTLLRKGGDEAITLGGKQFSVDDFYKGFSDVNSANSQAFRAEFVQEATESLQNGTMTRNGLGNALDEIQGVITTGFRERNPNLSRADHARVIQNQMDALEGAVNDAMKPSRTPNTSPNRNAPVLEDVGEDLNALAGKAGGELTPDKFLDGIKYDSSLVYNDTARNGFAQEMAKGFKTQNYFGDVVPTAENIANTARETYTTAINRSLISNPSDLPSGFRSPAEYIQSDVFAAQADNFANDVSQRYSRSVNTPNVETAPPQKSEAVEIAEIQAASNERIAEINAAGNRTPETPQQVVDETPPARNVEPEAKADDTNPAKVEDEIDPVKLQQTVIHQASNIQIKAGKGKLFGKQESVDKFIEDLRSNGDSNPNIQMADGTLTTPNQILGAVANGLQPSDSQITILGEALETIVDGTTKTKWSVPSTSNLSVRASEDAALSQNQARRVMDGLDPNPIANSFMGRHTMGITAAAVLTTSLSPLLLPEDSMLSQPGNTINGFVGGFRIPFVERTETDPVGVMVNKAGYRISGSSFIADALDYLEDPDNTGEFQREAVSEIAAERIGVAGQAGDENLKALTDPRAITLYALRSNVSLNDEQRMRLAQIESKIGGVIMDKVIQAETAVGAESNIREIENNIKQATVTAGRPTFQMGGSYSSTQDVATGGPSFPLEINSVFSELNTWGQNGPQIENTVQTAWSAAAGADGNNTIDNTQEWQQFRNGINNQKVIMVLDIMK